MQNGDAPMEILLINVEIVRLSFSLCAKLTDEDSQLCFLSAGCSYQSEQDRPHVIIPRRAGDLRQGRRGALGKAL